MTIKQLTNDITQSLQPLYDPREAAAVASWYVCARMRMERYELALRGNEPVDETLMPAIRRDMERLAEGCPLQYVLGETEFYGLSFKVSPAVLIPRPETEELVQRVVQQYEGQKVRIWDVGTGSGCIAISLAKMLPDVEVFATDISEDALAVARENAECNGVGVTFARHDMADVEHLPFGETRFDVIVSNPPYIPESERQHLERNVVDFEPSRALFVPDGSPLIFYDKIAQLAVSALNSGGGLYFETHEHFHPELKQLLERMGFTNIVCRNDFRGLPRFICGRKR